MQLVKLKIAPPTDDPCESGGICSCKVAGCSSCSEAEAKAETCGASGEGCSDGEPPSVGLHMVTESFAS